MQLANVRQSSGTAAARPSPVMITPNSSPPISSEHDVRGHAGFEPPRQGDHELVARNVTKRIVDQLEFIDVDIDHREAPLGAGDDRRRKTEVLDETGSG